MSNTRRASITDERSQHGFASARQYAEQRGVCGTLAAAKAEWIASQEAIDAICFLQGVSWRPGGLRKITAELLSIMPKPARGEFAPHVTVQQNGPALRFDFADYLRRVCIDPDIGFNFEFEVYADRRWTGTEEFNLIELLETYRDQRHKRMAADFIMTRVGEKVFETLDFGKRTGRFCVIEGDPRWGKSHAAKNWCERYPEKARYISLSGINSRLIFFRTVSQALGLPAGEAFKAVQMQTRVESFLQRTRIMLVVDEAQYLWPQQDRVTSHPELVNWCLTMCNQDVPIAFVTWAAFADRRRAVERQTDWHSGQLRGRIARYVQITTGPTEADYKAVAKKLLPNACASTLELIAIYAGRSKKFMQGVCDVVAEARDMAKSQGRESVTASDVRRVISDYCLPSDNAQKVAFNDVPKKPKRGFVPPAPSIERSTIPEDDAGSFPDRINKPLQLTDQL